MIQVRHAVLATLATALLSAASSSAEAPFGLTWGPVTDVPRPSQVDREANITALVYFAGRPPASGRDTWQVVLEVCREEGLQQVIWFSRVLDEPQLASAYAAIHREGVQRHGQPRAGPFPHMVVWPSARTALAVREVPAQGRQLVMATTGDGYADCSERHRAEAGHPASEHVSKLLGALP